MDIMLNLILGFATAIVVFILVKTENKKVGAWIGSAGTLFFILPIALIYLLGIAQMQSVSSNLSAMQQVADMTISRAITYFANNLPGEIVSELGGTIAGALIGIFSNRR